MSDVMKTLARTEEVVTTCLDKLNQKGEYSQSEMECVMNATKSLVNIARFEMLRQVGEDYEDYPREEASYRGGRSYTGSSYTGNGGRSYGGVPGGYYSYHSEKEHQIQTLESMMDKMKTEPERQVIRDSIERLRMLG